jgi:hypothetical protein
MVKGLGSGSSNYRFRVRSLGIRGSFAVGVSSHGAWLMV